MLILRFIINNHRSSSRNNLNLTVVNHAKLHDKLLLMSAIIVACSGS